VHLHLVVVLDAAAAAGRRLLHCLMLLGHP
jgi:hypothetical protein